MLDPSSALGRTPITIPSMCKRGTPRLPETHSAVYKPLAWWTPRIFEITVLWVEVVFHRRAGCEIQGGPLRSFFNRRTKNVLKCIKMYSPRKPGVFCWTITYWPNKTLTHGIKLSTRQWGKKLNAFETEKLWGVGAEKRADGWKASVLKHWNRMKKTYEMLTQLMIFSLKILYHPDAHPTLIESLSLIVLINVCLFEFCSGNLGRYPPSRIFSVKYETEEALSFQNPFRPKKPIQNVKKIHRMWNIVDHRKF